MHKGIEEIVDKFDGLIYSDDKCPNQFEITRMLRKDANRNKRLAVIPSDHPVLATCPRPTWIVSTWEDTVAIILCEVDDKVVLIAQPITKAKSASDAEKERREAIRRMTMT